LHETSKGALKSRKKADRIGYQNRKKNTVVRGGKKKKGGKKGWDSFVLF